MFIQTFRLPIRKIIILSPLILSRLCTFQGPNLKSDRNLTSADEIDMSADQETAQQNDACFSNKERPNT